MHAPIGARRTRGCCPSRTASPRRRSPPGSERQAKLEQQRDAMMRAVADAENARKRAKTEATAAQKYAVERFAEQLLPVLDSLQAALGSENTSPEALRSGVELTLKQLRAALERANIREISPAKGEP